MIAADIKLSPVPYRGETEAVRDLVGKLILASSVLLPISFSCIVAAPYGVLAVSSTERMPVMPDVPTFSEAGLGAVTYRWFRGFDAAWRDVVGHRQSLQQIA